MRPERLSPKSDTCPHTNHIPGETRPAVIAHPPAAYHGRPIKFYYATQAEVDPPTFVFFVNYPEELHFSYERYLQRRIREEFGFGGTAIRMRFRQRGSSPGAARG